MRIRIILILLIVVGLGTGIYQFIFSYPPAVGIVGKAKNCLVCHVNNGPWQDMENTIIDILDKKTKKSFIQADGSFLIEALRGKTTTFLTVIGRKRGDKAEAPYRNAWLYVDPERIKSDSLSKFAPGWNVNLPMACRIVGDNLEGFEGAKITALPMSIRAGDDAQDAELLLQVMMTKGESVKGKAKEGMIGNYFERFVRLKVLENYP
ncbi:MAG: hypothetical protein GTN76_00930 [Candidatus Aenigmarchaeota archaeon]|nr:hypothetical protein [Candidatus Aenigmarchaeota archaeon]